MEISNDMKSINVDSNGKIIPRIVIIVDEIDMTNTGKIIRKNNYIMEN